MLPGCLGRIFEYPRQNRIEAVCEGAADLAKDLHWRDGGCPPVSVLKQRWESRSRVVVGDCTAEGAPQPLNAVGLRVVRRRIHQHERSTQLSQQLSEQPRAPRGVDTQVVQE